MQTDRLGQNPAEYLVPSPDRQVDQIFLEAIADEVIPCLRGPRVAELGVGDMVWTPKLVDRFDHVTSVDGSEVLLAEMQKRLAGRGNWRGVLSYFEDYAPDAPFDEVLATYVLEHVDDPAVVVRRAASWLKPGGRLHVVVPSALSLHRRLAVVMGKIGHEAELGDTDRRMGHKRCFTAIEMQRLLAEVGLRVVERHGLLTKVLPNAALAACSEVQLRAMVRLGRELPLDYAGAIYFVAEVP